MTEQRMTWDEWMAHGVDPTVQSPRLTPGQQIVAAYEGSGIAEPCEFAAAIDKALFKVTENLDEDERLLHWCRNVIEKLRQCEADEGDVRWLVSVLDTRLGE